MEIDKGSFFMLVFTLGAGAAGGYFASEKHLFVPPPPPPPTAPPPPPVKESAAPLPPPPPPPKPAPTCDDMVGSPAQCPPPIWPSEEGVGGCGTLPTKRCEDYKKAMKPRVAERAVACINALNQTQRCDRDRLNLCGHAALMAACSIDEDPPEADAAPDDVVTHCNAVLRECGSVTPGPTLRDCRATLSGMNALGRDKMVDCMKTHCNDKGLLFCEAQVEPK
jgi:hypothetical protein